MKFILSLAFSALLLAFPANARDFVVKIEKLQSQIDIMTISVKGGTVSGLSKGREPQIFDIKVTLPDGTCTARLRIIFDPNSRNEMPMNFCMNDLVRIGTPKKTQPPPPPIPPQEHCKSVLANANTSRAAMIEAGMLYFRGFWWGEKCVTVDYKRAFDLLRKAHDSRTFNTFLEILKNRAATGNPKAISALEKIDFSPIAP